MKNSKKILAFLLVVLPLTFTFGSHGSSGGEFFDWLGLIVGIFFLWGLIQIIQNGNAQEENLGLEDELFDHFLDNEPSKE